MTSVTATGEFGQEARPRDFAARYRRSRPRALGRVRKRRSAGRHALVLAAAIAVPALAAPDDWTQFGIPHGFTSEVPVEPMPFEKAGSSFPGSAFYYLAADDAPLLAEGAVRSDADDAPTLVDPFAGPAARALRIDNSGVDRTRALQCLTAAIYYEAASEPDDGQRAVAQVVLNRVAHSAYPNTVCGVVYQGSERRTGCQFSFTCDGSLARVPVRMFWQRAQAVAIAALGGAVYAPVGLATHYHTIAVRPYWAPSLTYLGTIGAHRFYRFGGGAGQPGAFRFAYAGGEPVAAPHPRNAAADRIADPVLDPLAVQQAYEASIASARTQASAHSGGRQGPAAPGPAPVYAAEIRERGGDAIYRGKGLPDASAVRPEYSGSGQWKRPPGT